jgi:hypothetical protein
LIIQPGVKWETTQIGFTCVGAAGSCARQYARDRICWNRNEHNQSVEQFSSRKIEHATQENIPFRFIASSLRPDHDTIATFRKTFLAEIQELFV